MRIKLGDLPTTRARVAEAEEAIREAFVPETLPDIMFETDDFVCTRSVGLVWRMEPATPEELAQTGQWDTASICTLFAAVAREQVLERVYAEIEADRAKVAAHDEDCDLRPNFQEKSAFLAVA